MEINCDVSLYSKVYSPPYCAYNSAFGYGSGIKKTVKKQQIIKIKKRLFKHSFNKSCCCGRIKITKCSHVCSNSHKRLNNVVST